MNNSGAPFKRFWSIIYPPLLFIAISYAVQFVSGILLYLMNMKELIGISDFNAMYTRFAELTAPYYYRIMSISCLLTIPVMVLLLRRDVRGRVAAGKQPPVTETRPLFYLLTLAAGITFCLFINNLLVYSRLYELLFDTYSSTSALLYQSRIWEELLLTALLMPVVEELIFRGLLYGRLREYFGVKSAIFMSALYFGFYHGNLLQGFYSGLLGLLAAYLVERYGSLLAAVLLHVGANLVSVLVSETYWGQSIYQKESLFWTVTAVSMAALLGCLYLIINHAGKSEESRSAEF